jgi:hypothetical protein
MSVAADCAANILHGDGEAALLAVPAPLEESNKRFKTTVKGKTVNYGQPGSKIKPGTPKGDGYCARSSVVRGKGGGMRKVDCGGKDKGTPACLSRAKWRCSGEKSLRESTLLERTLARHVMLGEALTPADREEVARIVRRELKGKGFSDEVVRLVRNGLTQMFKTLYTRRASWRDGINSDAN